jgi:maltose alpha-D-glucosyltransferase / alpha-amylase
MSDDRHWYQDAIIYELRVRSFYDADGDGIGDFRGLTEKLDYLQDLGVTTLWLLPFYPSPLRDDGYDIADYTTVHASVGTLRDFQAFLKAAHAHGLKVVTELVLNHTSDQHPWFQRARRAPAGSRERDFYVWTDDPSRYPDARIIFQDFETSNWSWDPVAKAYFWHRFFSHQPDLNFDSPDVRRAMLDTVDHWFSMGVDGLRLDAVPYLYERDGTNCENLEETHAFLKELRAHIDAKFESRMLLAEANQWPEDAIAYFGRGDECHMAFHFPIMPRLFMALHMEDRFPILDILEQTPSPPEGCQWAMFLRNHDELTLEMVTDEERDYMVGVYARDPRARINLGIRRRLAPLLDNNRRRIELMKALLFSLPGTPVLYYGDEIGMGDNVYLGDRDGVRTPMQWSADRNAGFSRANPQRMILPAILDPEYHYEAINVETQQGNPSSLLWWTKRLIALRKQHPAFSRGTLEPLMPQNRKVFAFVRRHGEDALLVVANLSRFCQYVELDLSEFHGCSPVEMFGQAAFAPIGRRPYVLTLGPHSFYWFTLRSARNGGSAHHALSDDAPGCEVSSSWHELLHARVRSPLQKVLPRYLARQRWFRSKSRTIKAAHFAASAALGAPHSDAALALVDVTFDQGDPETYVLLLKGAAPPNDGAIVRVEPHRDVPSAVVIDAGNDAHLPRTLLGLVLGAQRHEGDGVELVGIIDDATAAAHHGEELPAPRLLGAEQSNTSFVYGDRFVMKLLRRTEKGQSIELELLRHLKGRGYQHAPGLIGHIDVAVGRDVHSTLAILQKFVPNEGDAWTFTVDEVQRYFERILINGSAADPAPAPPLLERARLDPPAGARERIGAYLDVARLLGQRTAELHLALADAGDDPAFRPERYTALSRRSYYQSLRNLSSRTLDALRERCGELPEPTEKLARLVLRREREIRSRLHHVLDHRLEGMRIRCHGDYHLGQLLYTGKDFVVVDFEGEPGRSLADRRRRRSPFADIAGMLRSFHYAVSGVLTGELQGGVVRPEDRPMLERWAPLWYAWTSGAFLGRYLELVRPAGLVPDSDAELGLVLDIHLLEKAVYEITYELNNRPNWLSIPLRGVLNVLDERAAL